MLVSGWGDATHYTPNPTRQSLKRYRNTNEKCNTSSHTPSWQHKSSPQRHETNLGNTNTSLKLILHNFATQTTHNTQLKKHDATGTAAQHWSTKHTLKTLLHDLTTQTTPNTPPQETGYNRNNNTAAKHLATLLYNLATHATPNTAKKK